MLMGFHWQNFAIYWDILGSIGDNHLDHDFDISSYQNFEITWANDGDNSGEISRSRDIILI